MFKYSAYFLLVAVAINHVTCDTPVYECDTGVELPLLTQINDCEELPCPLEQGSTVVMNATFRSTVDTEKLRPEVVAYALGIELNYPLDEPDGCKALIGGQCPIEEGEIVRYMLNMPILSLYPTIPLSMRFTIYDENDNGLTCFMMDAKVVKPETL